MTQSFHPPFRLGPWTVQPSLLRFVGPSATDGEDPCRLVGHKVMAVLVCLASHRGQVVSKETLIAEVWDGAFTSDETLTTAVYELRKALDDSARQPRFVETIRKGGYRLVAQVEPLEEAASEVPGTSESGASDVHSEVPGTPGSAPFVQVPGTSEKAALKVPGTSESERSGQVPGTSDAPSRQVPGTSRPKQLRFVAAGLIALALLAVVAWTLRPRPTSSGETAVAAAASPPTETSPEDATAGLTSLAVLPLTHFGETCGEDAFTGGLTDMLVVDLAAEVPLEVLPSLVTRSHGERWNLQQVTEELDADLVIEGSVVRSAERIWLSVQLVDTSSGKLLWGGSYERSMEDPLLVQRDLASSIAGEVQRIVIEATASAIPSTDTASPPLNVETSASLPGR